MTHAILLSIHPKWAKLIYEGKKTIEWRKNKPRLVPSPPLRTYKEPIKIFMYETAPVCKVTGLFYWQGTKNIIIRDPDYEGQEICKEAKEVIEMGCVPLDDLKKYQGNKEKIFGWICGVFEKFEQPKHLADFGLKRAPQSWQYVEVNNG